MLPVLKGIHFNYLEQPRRQNHYPDYPLPWLCFKSTTFNTQGLVDDTHLLPGVSRGGPKTGGFIAPLASLWTLDCSGCRPRPPKDSMETRTYSSESVGSKSLCLWYWGFIFPLDAVMRDSWRGNSLQFIRLQIYRVVWKYLPCVWNCWRGKRKCCFLRIYENRNIDLFCLGFVTLLTITWCFLVLWEGPKFYR